MRYVVLHHIGVTLPHFDLLYEAEPDAMLTSFRCPRWPPEVGDVLEEMPEHRRMYLDYEGEVSHGRGSVVRIDAGTVITVDLTIDPPTFALALATGVEIVLTHLFNAGDDRTTLWTVSSMRIAAR